MFDLETRFFAPTRNIAKPARAGAVKVGRRTNLSACSALARPYLDGSEHDGTLDAIGVSRVASISLRMSATANTPVEPLSAYLALFPSGDSLPRFNVRVGLG